jgi:predicted protein tyrosine phosphatase
MPLFKFTAEFLVRSASKEKAEQEVKVEFGSDVYESHIICEEIPDEKQEADIELIKA